MPSIRFALVRVLALLAVGSLGLPPVYADEPGTCVAGCRWVDGVLVCDQPCTSPSASSPGSGRGFRAARFKLGLLGAPGLGVDDGTRVTTGGGLGGVEAEVHMGRPRFGFELGAGVWATRMTAPPFDGDPATPIVFLGWIGLTSSPTALVQRPSFELRPDVGVDFLVGYCDTCLGVGGYGARVKVGLDFYLGAARNGGVALDVLAPLLILGALPDDPVAVELPPFAIRLSIVVRNLNLAGW